MGIQLSLQTCITGRKPVLRDQACEALHDQSKCSRCPGKHHPHEPGISEEQTIQTAKDKTFALFCSLWYYEIIVNSAARKAYLQA